jgi:hypothetical protein
MPQTIDVDTPKSAHTRKGFDGFDYEIVFSDEFNTPGRTFYPGSLFFSFLSCCVSSFFPRFYDNLEPSCLFSHCYDSPPLSFPEFNAIFGSFPCCLPPVKANGSLVGIPHFPLCILRSAFSCFRILQTLSIRPLFFDTFPARVAFTTSGHFQFLFIHLIDSSSQFVTESLVEWSQGAIGNSCPFFSYQNKMGYLPSCLLFLFWMLLRLIQKAYNNRASHFSTLSFFPALPPSHLLYSQPNNSHPHANRK